MSEANERSTIRTLAEGAYLTYPHSSGFLDGGARVALGRPGEPGGHARVVAVPLDGGADREEELCRFPVSAGAAAIADAPETLWFDLAASGRLLAANRGDTLWVADPRRPGTRPEPLYRAPAGHRLDQLVSVSTDGGRVATAEARPDGTWAALLIEAGSGTVRTLLSRPWHVDHVHFCPHDEAWIGFAHEGNTHTVPDRVWAWHAEHAPEGVCVFDQRAVAEPTEDGVPADFVRVGHERWAFHDASAVVVAYGESPVGPRGLWEVSPLRPPRLLAAHDRYWHCDISRDGTRALVDTIGPHEILLLDLRTGAERSLARAGSGTHPYHPHPVFSPDGRHALFNDAHTAGPAATGRVVVAALDPP